MTDHYSVEEFPFTNSEHKPRFRSISMLSNSPIMRDICAHNYLEINKEDAAELGIKDGDTVRAVTPLGDVSEGEAMVRGGQVDLYKRQGYARTFGDLNDPESDISKRLAEANGGDVLYEDLGLNPCLLYTSGILCPRSAWGGSYPVPRVT